MKEARSRRTVRAASRGGIFGVPERVWVELLHALDEDACQRAQLQSREAPAEQPAIEVGVELLLRVVGYPDGNRAVIDGASAEPLLIACAIKPRLKKRQHREAAQDESRASYEGWCRRAEARINWASHVDFVYNVIRGCNPAPGAWTTLGGQDLQVFDAKKVPVRTFGAVRGTIDHLVEHRGLTRQDAYVLCSLAADLKITEIVDAPNWIVACFVPDAVFTAD